MPEQLLAVLKVCLLVLLYLFFLRVLRAVWTEIGAARQPEALPVRRSGKPKKVRRGAPAMVVVEPKAAKGTRYELSTELSIGRSGGCAITVDDTFVSQVHARVFRRDSQFYVEDLGSTNGTYLNRKKVQGVMQLTSGDQVQVGNTVLELG